MSTTQFIVVRIKPDGERTIVERKARRETADRHAEAFRRWNPQNRYEVEEVEAVPSKKQQLETILAEMRTLIERRGGDPEAARGHADDLLAEALRIATAGTPHATRGEAIVAAFAEVVKWYA